MDPISYITAAPGNYSLLQQQLDETANKRVAVKAKLAERERVLAELEKTYESKKSGLFSMFSKKETVENLAREVETTKAEVDKIKNELAALTVNIDPLHSTIDSNQYATLVGRFTDASQSEKVWNVTQVKANAGKSAAKATFDRKEVSISIGDIDAINSQYKPFLFKNSYGPDLYVYPSMAIQFTPSGQVLLYDIKKLTFKFHPTRFLESESNIPSDSKIIDQVWNKVNKDGTPDMRFADNFQRPVVRYGLVSFSVNTGIDISYHLSNYEDAENFAKTFMQVVKPAGAMITASGEQIAGSDLTSPAANSGFSEQYYNLLVGYAVEIKTMFDKLNADKSFLTRLNIPFPMTGEMFVQSTMTYDICQILKQIVDEKGHKKGLETAGLTFMTCYIRPDNIDPLGKGYATVTQAYAKDIYAKVSKGILEIGESPKVMTVKGDNSIFSLLPVLRLHKHPLAEAYTNFLYQCANILAKADNTVTPEEEEKLKKVYQLLHAMPSSNNTDTDNNTSKDTVNTNKGEPSADTIEDVLAEVNALIGLNGVKQEINTLVNFIKVQKAREKSGLAGTNLSYHIVFTGSPGTGKTTIARMIAKIYKALGVLDQGQLIETDRSGLVAEYVGQTAPKVNNLVDTALDGVLFIDEAYALAGEGNDFGKEAVSTLIKRMEDERDRLIVIMAGYTNEMTNFIETNPGFKSRINRYLEFTDYTPDELLAIYASMCKKAEYIINDDAMAKLKTLFETAYANKDKSFGNARFARNVYEKTLEMQANRIAAVTDLTKEVLTTITVNDVPELKQH